MRATVQWISNNPIEPLISPQADRTGVRTDLNHTDKTNHCSQNQKRNKTDTQVKYSNVQSHLCFIYFSIIVKLTHM